MSTLALIVVSFVVYWRNEGPKPKSDLQLHPLRWVAGRRR